MKGPTLSWLGTVGESQLDYIVCPWGVSQFGGFDLYHRPVKSAAWELLTQECQAGQSGADASPKVRACGLCTSQT